jgi:hypothetical protein
MLDLFLAQNNGQQITIYLKLGEVLRGTLTVEMTAEESGERMFSITRHQKDGNGGLFAIKSFFNQEAVSYFEISTENERVL